MRRSIALAASLLITLAACGGTTPVATTTTAGTVTTVAAGTTPPATVTQGPRDLTFMSGGHTLAASHWQGGATWVVLGHMLPSDRSGWAAFGDLLHAAGYSVLAYDNKGFGDSEGSREPFALYQDATAAISFAHANGASRIVYGGASMNGATAVQLGVFYELAAIVVLSGVTNFPSVTDALGAMFEVDEPILFVAAEDDPGAVTDLDAFLDRSQTADYMVIPAGGHGTDMLTNDPELPGRILDWLLEEAPQPGP